MKRFLLALALPCCLVGQVNLDLKEGLVDQTPPGWTAPTAPYYSVKLSEQCGSGVARCAIVRFEGQGESRPFGNIMQTFRGTALRNKIVRFRASVKVDDPVRGRAALWLRVDRADSQMGFFDNMRHRPILSTEWQFYEITGEMDPDADLINIGMMLQGEGAAYLANISLEVIGIVEPLAITERSRPLSGRGLENLVAFAKLFGYVRHFYPSDQAAKADWDALAITGIREVEHAKDAADLAKKLEDFFRPVAPSLRVYPIAAKVPSFSSTPPPGKTGLKLVQWEHKGFGTGNPSSLYKSERKQLPAPAKLPEPFRAALGAGVASLIPTALFADADGTLPHAPVPEKAKSPRYSVEERAVRLGDVVLAWNVFEHFYPYFDVVKTDWSVALNAALKSAAVNTPDQFGDTLRTLVAGLHDGHGRVHSQDQLIPPALPWAWVEDLLVITKDTVIDGQTIAAGDAVVSIDGVPLSEAGKDASAIISAATPQWQRAVALRTIGRGAPGTVAKVEFESLASPRMTYTVNVGRMFQGVAEDRPTKISQIKPDIWYVDLTRITQQDWSNAIKDLATAKALVFDLRGYPRLPPMFLNHLTQVPITSAQWHIPQVTVPGRQNMKFTRGGEWDLKPAEPYLNARRAFLTNGSAISYAESVMGIVEHYQLGEIVGETTAGTNGNVNPFSVPGGYTLIWTGMKVLKHDGSQHHGVGIKPTIPVSRTRAGVAAGRDEVLERALLLFDAP